MPDALEKIKSKITKGRGNQGFTLVETLIAGLLLTLVMTAVGRLSLSAMAGSSNLAERRRVEAAIDNHIQLIQQADSLLTYDSLPSNHRTGEEGSTRACRNPMVQWSRCLCCTPQPIQVVVVMHTGAQQPCGRAMDATCTGLGGLGRRNRTW